MLTPKAPAHGNRDAPEAKDQSGSSRQILSVKAISQTSHVHQSPNLQFRPRVAGPNKRHLGAYRLIRLMRCPPHQPHQAPAPPHLLRPEARHFPA